MSKRINTKKLITALAWSLVAGLVCFVFIAARVQREQVNVSGLYIDIESAGGNFFVSKDEVRQWVAEWGRAEVNKLELGSLDIRGLEAKFEKKLWIDDAEIFIDDTAALHIKVAERKPIARIFNLLGESFYVDSAARRLPAAFGASARVPVFTSFPATMASRLKTDSSLILKIIRLGDILLKDEFLFAMVEQIDISADRKFEMIPKLGKQIIYFGDTSRLQEKADNLKAFYKNIMPYAGWNKFSSINLSYKGQVVATVRDAAAVAADSVRTLMLMEMLAQSARQKSIDSLNNLKVSRDVAIDSSVIMGSVERDDNPENFPNDAAPLTDTTRRPKPPAAPTQPKPAVNPNITTTQQSTPKPKPKPPAALRPGAQMPKKTQ